MRLASTKPGRGQAPADDQRLFHRDYLFILGSSFSVGASFYVLAAVMPIYARSLGAGPFEIGLVTGVFASIAFLSRLPTAFVIDRIRRKWVMVTGAAIFGLSPLGYALVGTVPALLALRAFNGIGMATFVTAGQTLATIVSPAKRRAEAMGVYTTAYNISLGFGPALGVLVASEAGFASVFLVCAGLGFVSALSAAQVRESPLKVAPIGKRRLLNRDALGPSVFMFASMFAYGGLFTFGPILAIERGLPNAGLPFITYTVGLMLSQWSAGRMSDRFGRAKVILPGLAVTGLALWLLAFSQGWLILAASLAIGIGVGATQPSLFAVAADRGKLEERGSAMATIGMALEVGIASGAIVGGIVAGGIALQGLPHVPGMGVSGTFIVAGSLPALCAVLALAWPASLKWLVGRV